MTSMRFRQVGHHDDDDSEKPTLEAVLDHYGVRYREGRRSQMVSCPLHEDRTPSLSLNLDKGVVHCHSCGFGGDSYALLMIKEGIDFAGARSLSASLGLATDGAGGGSDGLPRGRYARRSSLPARKGDRPGGGPYIPAWRRR